DKLCLKPKDTIYLGDSGVDMLTANNAGLYACGVLWGFRQADELLENGAKMLIHTPSDILQLL
ncbi:MAG: HAD hydrolase-like protein, partial [Oscillospiraceae bacterium]